MITAQTMAGARRLAESLMVDTVTITRAGTPTPDPETGLETPSTVTIYSGKAKIQTFEPYESEPDGVAHQYVSQRLALHIPVGAGPVAVDDIATVTAAPRDPAMVGRSFRIAASMNKTAATAQRLPIEFISA